MKAFTIEDYKALLQLYPPFKAKFGPDDDLFRYVQGLQKMRAITASEAIQIENMGIKGLINKETCEVL